jgi:hypothetical protein
VPSIGLAAGARIAQAPGLPGSPAPGACMASMQSGRGHGPQFVAGALSPAAAGALSPGASIARGHIYLAPVTTVVVVARPGARRRAPRSAKHLVVKTNLQVVEGGNDR